MSYIEEYASSITTVNKQTTDRRPTEPLAKIHERMSIIADTCWRYAPDFTIMEDTKAIIINETADVLHLLMREHGYVFYINTGTYCERLAYSEGRAVLAQIQYDGLSENPVPELFRGCAIRRRSYEVTGEIRHQYSLILNELGLSEELYWEREPDKSYDCRTCDYQVAVATWKKKWKELALTTGTCFKPLFGSTKRGFWWRVRLDIDTYLRVIAHHKGSQLAGQLRREYEESY